MTFGNMDQPESRHKTGFCNNRADNDDCSTWTAIISITFILLAVENEVCLRRAGDVNPLIVGHTKNQGTHVPRSPQFSRRGEALADFLLSNRLAPEAQEISFILPLA